MKNPLVVGIAGCGYWGPNLARNFHGIAGVRLGAICDLDPGRLTHMRKLHPTATFHEDFDSMLSEGQMDAVVIATPLRSHHALAKAALLAGKHVLIEKPMAGSSGACAELISLAAERKLTLMVGHTYLYSAAVLKISEIIRSGEIGEIRYINCQRLNLGIFHSDINVAWDLAPHDLSIIVDVMGDVPLTVNCQGNGHIRPEIEDVTNISMNFSNHRFATIQSSWLEPRKVRQMTFVGTRKMIVFDDLQPLEKIRIHDVRVDSPPHYDNFADFQCSYHYGDCHIPHIAPGEPLARMCEDFVNSATRGYSPISCGTKGLEIVRILEACDESLRSGGGQVALREPRGVPLASQGESLDQAS